MYTSFLPFFGCSLILWIVPCGALVLNFDKVYSVFSFVAFAFGVTSRKSLPNPLSEHLSCVFEGFSVQIFDRLEVDVVYGCISGWLARL